MSKEANAMEIYFSSVWNHKVDYYTHLSEGHLCNYSFSFVECDRKYWRTGCGGIWWTCEATDINQLYHILFPVCNCITEAAHYCGQFLVMVHPIRTRLVLDIGLGNKIIYLPFKKNIIIRESTSQRWVLFWIFWYIFRASFK